MRSTDRATLLPYYSTSLVIHTYGPAYRLWDAMKHIFMEIIGAVLLVGYLLVVLLESKWHRWWVLIGFLIILVIIRY